MSEQIKSINNIEEIIFAFLDGELREDKEMELMSILAKDSHARSIFKFFLGLKHSTSELRSQVSVPTKVENKAFELLSKKEAAIKSASLTPKTNLHFWQRKISLTPIMTAAACIIIFFGAFFLSKTILTNKLKYVPDIRIENIDDISTMRKYIKKVKITYKDRIDIKSEREM